MTMMMTVATTKRTGTNRRSSENLTNNAPRSSTASSEHEPVGDPA